MNQIQDERRRFRRYKRETPVNIIRDKKAFEVSLLDYSPFGIRIKSRPIFQVGEEVDIIIDHHHLKGRIVWVRGENTGISINGPIAGDLRSYRLWDLLIGLRRSQKTGVLNLVSDEIKKTIYIKSGEPIFARSNIEDERFGEFLLKRGLITLDAYNHSVELMKRTGKRQGAVLVEAGYIKAQELPGLVMAQIEEIIKNALKLFSGSFEFIEGPLPTDEIIVLKLSLANLIYRGIKTIESFQFIRSEIGDLDSIPVPSMDPYDLFQDISLDDTDRKLLSLIDGRNTINDILKNAWLNHFETLKTLYALLATRIIELKEVDKVSNGQERIKKQEEKVISMDELIKNGDLDEGFLREVEELYQRVDTMTHYEVLGLNNTASPSEIKRVYYSLVKRFHPDRYYRIGHDELKEKLSKIFTRINQAYTILSDFTKRHEYDTTLKEGSQSTDLAHENFEAGMKFYQEKSYHDAATAFGKAVYLDSSKPKYHFYYGLALRESGKYKEAEKSLLKAIELWPGNADYVTELGYLYLRLDMKLRARKTFERALSIDPNSKKARDGLKLSGE